MKIIVNIDKSRLVVYQQIEVREVFDKYYVEGSEEDLLNLPMRVIVRSDRNNVIRVISSHKIIEYQLDEIVEEERFSTQIIEAIKDYSAVVGSDASVKRRYMGRY